MADPAATAGDAEDGPERRVWSREEFLHERCAAPGDDEQTGRGSRRSVGSRRRSRADSAGDSADSGGIGSPGSSGDPGSGVITASLKIPVPGAGAAFALSVDDSDIPYIEEAAQDGRHQVTVGLVRGSGQAAPATQRRRQRSGSGSDSSVAPRDSRDSRDSAVGSSATLSSPPRNVTPSSSGSPPSWASSPPLSPDPVPRTVNYIPDDPVGSSARVSISSGRSYSRTASSSSEHHVQTTTLTPGVVVQRVTFTSIGDANDQVVREARTSASTVRETISKPSKATRDLVPTASTYQRILSSLTGSELSKSATTSFIGVGGDREREVERVLERGPDRVVTPSISSIGGAVLRSKTADIERMLRISRAAPAVSASVAQAQAQVQVSLDDKKKYNKRRYTDARHQTRHIPEPDVLGQLSQLAGVERLAGRASGAGTGGGGATGVAQGVGSRGVQGPVWKRREIIASDPKRRDAV